LPGQLQQQQGQANDKGMASKASIPYVHNGQQHCRHIAALRKCRPLLANKHQPGQ